MADKVELTDRKLRNLKPALPGQRYEIADTHIGGLRVRIGDAENDDGKAGAVSFVLYARFPPATNATRRAIGTYPAMSLADARDAAKDWKRQIASGIDPKAEAKRERLAAVEAAAEYARNVRTFDKVADLWLAGHVEKAKRRDGAALRSAPEIRRMIEHVRPRLGALEIGAIKRRDIADLLDQIEAMRGPSAADKTLANLSSLFSWWQARDDEFISPAVKGMRRLSAADHSRSRIIGQRDGKADDAEIKAFWEATGEAGMFGSFCRLLLLTGQRRAKVAAMRWQDIDASGLWTIPGEAREKTNAGALLLPPMAMAELARLNEREGNPYVFAGRLKASHVAGFSKLKPKLDEMMTKALGGPVAPWVLHDLRRTARSLMARAGVEADIAERVLGHAIPGVQGIYDRHSYAAEKASALARLADLIGQIVEPAGGNVVTIKQRAKA
jgi:integrase